MDDEHAWSRLRDKGLRITPLKREIVGLFLSGACGLSAGEVLRQLSGTPHISSVHRCLRSLEQAGFLRPDRSEEGLLRYRCSSSFYPDHGHFRCRECGRRLPVEYSLPESFVRDMERSGGFKVAGSDLFLEGKCGRCTSSGE
jgi:Fe2+ or Zn2+ uptake regulation protein